MGFSFRFSFLLCFLYCAISLGQECASHLLTTFQQLGRVSKAESNETLTSVLQRLSQLYPSPEEAESLILKNENEILINLSTHRHTSTDLQGRRVVQMQTADLEFLKKRIAGLLSDSDSNWPIVVDRRYKRPSRE